MTVSIVEVARCRHETISTSRAYTIHIFNRIQLKDIQIVEDTIIWNRQDTAVRRDVCHKLK